MSLLGEDGFKRLATLNHEAACKTADALTSIDGVELVTENFFNEFTIELPTQSKEVVEVLAAKGIIGGLAADDNKLLVAATEVTTDEDIDAFKAALQEVLSEVLS